MPLTLVIEPPLKKATAIVPRTLKTTVVTPVETIEPVSDARPTLVTFLLDRTGSMEMIKTDTIGGFNAYLDTLEREAGNLVEFTLLQFDSTSVDKLYVGAKLSQVARLTATTYIPRHYTPLYDACVKAIKATEAALAHRKDAPRVVVVFQTDGDENASREYNERDLQDLIKQHTAEGWEFLYLGANIDAYKAAQRFGIPTDNTVSYNSAHSQQLFSASASNIGSYARGMSAGTSYSMSQKAAAGDTSALTPGSSVAGSFGISGLVVHPPATKPRSKTKIVDDLKL